MKIKAIVERVPEIKDLTEEQKDKAFQRATAKIKDIHDMEEIDKIEETARMCLELEYLREVKNFQKALIQKRAKGGG